MELAERKWTVYLHTNKINGKQYVGITCREPKIRWGSNGINYKGTVFGRAINKYGWDNFEHEIIEENLSCEEASEKEKYYIQFYNSLVPNGYNCAYGGYQNNYSENTKIAVSNAKSIPVICVETKVVYKNSVEAGLDNGVSSAAIYAATTSRHKKSAGYHWMKYKDYLENGFTEKFNPHYRQVICIETRKVYGNAYSAEKELGYCVSSVANCCNKKTKSTHGNHWMYYDEYLTLEEKPVYDSPGLSKKRVKCVETGEIFDSLRKAGMAYNISSGTISPACKNPNRTAAGYHWQYIE